MSEQPNNVEVICPNCSHQFGAISINDQEERAQLRLDNERLRGQVENVWFQPPKCPRCGKRMTKWTEDNYGEWHCDYNHEHGGKCLYFNYELTMILESRAESLEQHLADKTRECEEMRHVQEFLKNVGSPEMEQLIQQAIYGDTSAISTERLGAIRTIIARAQIAEAQLTTTRAELQIVRALLNGHRERKKMKEIKIEWVKSDKRALACWSGYVGGGRVCTIEYCMISSRWRWVVQRERIIDGPNRWEFHPETNLSELQQFAQLAVECAELSWENEILKDALKAQVPPEGESPNKGRLKRG